MPHYLLTNNDLCHLFAVFFCVRVLVGTGRACFESLRPLAYSLLAEIVHHVRADLSLSQVLPVVSVPCVSNFDFGLVFLLFASPLLSRAALSSGESFKFWKLCKTLTLDST